MSGSSESELISGIAAAPDDDGPRLVYADWLGDRGDPRGELVVVQCALARADRDDRPALETRPLHDRATELMKVHRDAWLEPILDVAVGNYQFRRGFIEVMDVLQPNIDAARLRVVCPLLRAIKTSQANLAELFDYIDTIRLDELTIYRIADEMMVRRVFEEPRLATLSSLDVHYESGRPHLSDLARLTIPVRRLGLRFDRRQPFDQPGLLDNLVASPARAALRSLDLAHAHAEDLHALERLPLLAELTLTSCSFDLEKLATLALPALTSLAMTDVVIDADALVALVAAFPSLRRLRISSSSLGDRQIAALAGSSHAARLRRLDLSRNQIGERGALAIADGLSDLVWLDLSDNHAATAARDRIASSLTNADVRW